MSRFNQRGVKPRVTSPVTTSGARTVTAEGGSGHLRDPRSELFLLAISNVVGTDTFYEKGGDRDDRYQRLVRRLAIEDPRWTAALLAWLRGDGNMRTAALVGAAEFTAERLRNDAPGYSRQVVGSVLQRPDEPGEFLAYWTSTFGRRLPKPVKRGVADAVQRLYSERSLLKYDTESKGYRFGDVLELVHPSPAADKPWQGDLFKHAIDRRHGRGDDIPAALRIVRGRAELMAVPVGNRRGLLGSGGGDRTDGTDGTDGSSRIAAAGMTWEALAGWLQGPMDKVAWETVIPSMGVFALVRNLRNFDRAGVSDEAAAQVAATICDPERVARSRMLPFRFWAAHKHVASLRWGHALDKALNLSLANVPALPGRTLILVDRSPSMFPGFGFSTPNSSDITLAEQAAVFGAALAVRAADPTLVEFGMRSRPVAVPKGGSVLRLIEKFGRIDGTDIPSAVKAHFRGHDRIVVVTDEQTRPGWFPSNASGHGGMRETEIDALVPKNVPVYMWNMAGYKAGAMPSGTGDRHTFGGLTDHAFGMIPLLESGRSASWPWER
ncbi:TROVE domain-containing protein [Streptomyces sp. NPDC087422]|uniref:TROVE domain-containing protein n=1 Tax=Streptomyces sp. NPDC087422 TaxID=3365786 RepID=UPI0037FA49F4